MNPAPHILFVDDDEEDRLIILEYFREMRKDQQVRFTKNGRDAIRFLEEVPADDALPGLVVLDLNMPILSGTQTLLEMKRTKRFKDIPVIILSTSENENEKRKCLSLGAEEYLVKPSTYREGLLLVEKFLRYL